MMRENGEYGLSKMATFQEFLPASIELIHTSPLVDDTTDDNGIDSIFPPRENVTFNNK